MGFMMVISMKNSAFLREYIQSVMIDRRWTKAELARQSGVSASNIGRILDGDKIRELTADTTERLADAMGVSPDMLGEISKNGRNRVDLNPKEKSDLAIKHHPGKPGQGIARVFSPKTIGMLKALDQFLQDHGEVLEEVIQAVEAARENQIEEGEQENDA